MLSSSLFIPFAIYVDGQVIKLYDSANHPRDLCDQILDIANFTGDEPAIIREMIDRAAGAYSVEL